MGQVLQNGERLIDDVVALAAVEVGDHSDATGIMFESRVVESPRGGGTTLRALHQAPSGHLRGEPRAVVSRSTLRDDVGPNAVHRY